MKTNVQVVKDIMEHSSYGGLSQLFVMDALHKLSKAVASSTPEEYGDKSIIDPEAWIGVAKEIQRKLEEQ
jgi:hypothetical protein